MTAAFWTHSRRTSARQKYHSVNVLCSLHRFHPSFDGKRVIVVSVGFQRRLIRLADEIVAAIRVSERGAVPGLRRWFAMTTHFLAVAKMPVTNLDHMRKIVKMTNENTRLGVTENNDISLLPVDGDSANNAEIEQNALPSGDDQAVRSLKKKLLLASIPFFVSLGVLFWKIYQLITSVQDYNASPTVSPEIIRHIMQTHNATRVFVISRDQNYTVDSDMCGGFCKIFVLLFISAGMIGIVLCVFWLLLLSVDEWVHRKSNVHNDTVMSLAENSTVLAIGHQQLVVVTERELMGLEKMVNCKLITSLLPPVPEYSMVANTSECIPSRKHSLPLSDELTPPRRHSGRDVKPRGLTELLNHPSKAVRMPPANGWVPSVATVGAGAWNFLALCFLHVAALECEGRFSLACGLALSTEGHLSCTSAVYCIFASDILKVSTFFPTTPQLANR
ncbi:unnamed protein product [Notodromas monacha]|uniref:Uncharacterized protein n=1 Tax=Notodromas monacha TaxID=399045 RepID=A0A7R9GBW5_9CRUS|nr:unnamed protein product [Notodromas monacha]CAG0915221.1 unnamed protein product [Notodromas monacha]